MSASITPDGQEILINPYSNKLFDFDTYSSKVYISRSVNNLLRSIGNDCILDGLITNANYNEATDVVTFVTNPGKAIIDTTLVEITSSNNTLELDLTPFDNSGYLIVTLSYRFLNTLYSNFAKLKVFYVTPNGNDLVPNDFQVDYDRIILAAFNFDKASKTITPIDSTLTNPTFKVIHNKQFPIFPRNQLLINSFSEICTLFVALNYI